MSININLVTISGFVTQDALAGETLGGARMATFPLRYTDTYKKPDGGTVNSSYPARIIAYGRAADYALEHVRSGCTVMVCGKLALVSTRRGGNPVESIIATTIQVVYTPNQSGSLC